MSKILCTFPGKHGDILWALPTIREISRVAGEPVDLMIGAQFARMVGLLDRQSYLCTVWAEQDWVIQDTAPASPRIPPGVGRLEGWSYAKIYHLGYPGWPALPLPAQTMLTAADLDALPTPLAPYIDPWITPYREIAASEIQDHPRSGIYFGWTDEWLELKLGVMVLLQQGLERAGIDLRAAMHTHSTSRWVTELLPAPQAGGWAASWIETAQEIASCQLYVGCLSAQWVLANALGIPCVVVEPNPHRHNPIFWWPGPTEKDGQPRNTMVLGNDGKPTFDARAVVTAVKQQLQRYKA